ncbi:MAG: tRNA (adenosine(37)-N6)-threonylcarbamoyltransferase complex ATPase subunit type 1 TsaE [Betaproteobacteria bacterium]|nr:tRNA (adenosine(37)-N6)-threonylcarbamoyltransferase complex ATPase subunit type 1 TsaE [Betaproteobacteria bacterium]MDE2004003.1 tRNA (adenosine(37)-N6)-threonylcarbamoyltransferase complex ATPase subunit type 1 TsaE [Betaproteobacteria bacterium]MDE2209513.1 tRNA (adenosine(37)-N6)-threonylcarbamoyltransferase complex ATPase subunit type 1 TsaE [Betaproteobacteria bacterium]
MSSDLELNLHLPDAGATERCGALLAPSLAGRMVVTLHGDLGVGKTTLVRGLLRARGVTGRVKSPSYGLVEHYPISSLYFYHIDFYRFTDSAEWENAGLAECFRDDSVCLIEWPERVAGLLPAPDLALDLAHSAQGGGRELRARALSAAGERCLNALAAGMQTPR